MFSGNIAPSNTLKIHNRYQCKKLHPDAILPSRKSLNDVGFDVCARLDTPMLIPPNCRVMVPIGIATEFDRDMYCRVAPRSGLAVKNWVDAKAGVVDSGYRNEINVVLHNSHPTDTFVVNDRDRIAQLIFEQIVVTDHLKVPEVAELSDSKRGTSGFGSSGTSGSLAQ